MGSLSDDSLRVGTDRIFQLVLTSNKATRFTGHLFEDTIDGYFPLHVSLRHMLERNGFGSAVVTLQYAPIMHIPGLPHDAPVPLNIKTGFAGMIEKMSFCVAHDRICGTGTWHWMLASASSKAVAANELNAMTRLAEPCYLEGCGFPAGKLPTMLLGSTCQSNQGSSNITDVRPSMNKQETSLWGPFQPEQMTMVDPVFAMHGAFKSGAHNVTLGQYIIHTTHNRRFNRN